MNSIERGTGTPLLISHDREDNLRGRTGEVEAEARVPGHHGRNGRWGRRSRSGLGLGPVVKDPSTGIYEVHPAQASKMRQLEFGQRLEDRRSDVLATHQAVIGLVVLRDGDPAWGPAGAVQRTEPQHRGLLEFVKPLVVHVGNPGSQRSIAAPLLEESERAVSKLREQPRRGALAYGRCRDAGGACRLGNSVPDARLPSSFGQVKGSSKPNSIEVKAELR